MDGRCVYCQEPILGDNIDEREVCPYCGKENCLQYEPRDYTEEELDTKGTLMVLASQMNQMRIIAGQAERELRTLRGIKGAVGMSDTMSTIGDRFDEILEWSLKAQGRIRVNGLENLK